MTIPTSSFPPIKFAFQPIVNATKGVIVGFEAMVRGPNNESSNLVLEQVNSQDLLAFDQYARDVAISTAVGLNLQCNLNLNFMPQGLEISAAPLKSTLDAAERNQLKPCRLTIEITETQIINDIVNFVNHLNQYRGTGLNVAIDDFGGGFSGLNLLADFQPDVIKLDMSLIRDIATRGPRQAIVRGILRTTSDLGIDVIADGVETMAEFIWCHEEGIDLFQGALFAMPAFEQLPIAYYPQIER